MRRILSTGHLLHPARRHGLVFDCAFLLSALLVPLNVLDRGPLPSDSRIAVLLGVAVVAQIPGASVKNHFLEPRLIGRDPEANGIAGKFLSVVLFFHFLLFTVSILLALTLGGVYLADESTSFWRGDVWVAVALVLGAVTTGIVAAAGMGAGEETPEPEAPAWLEYVGDAFLLLSVWILTWLFWDMLIVAELDGGRGAGFSSRGIVLLVATTFLFVVFYLPARYLYLVEDYRWRRTWVQIALAIGPVYWAIVIG